MWNVYVKTHSTHKYCINFTCWCRYYHLYNGLRFTKRSKNEKDICISESDDMEKWVFDFQLFNITSFFCKHKNEIIMMYSQNFVGFNIDVIDDDDDDDTKITRKLYKKKMSHSCEYKWWHSQFISISRKWHENAYETLGWHLVTASIGIYVRMSFCECSVGWNLLCMKYEEVWRRFSSRYIKW